jgi:NADH-quinone oxidoreductase subunit B
MGIDKKAGALPILSDAGSMPGAGAANFAFTHTSKLDKVAEWLQRLSPYQKLVQPAVNHARANSIWPLTFGLACCAIEMMATGGSRYDLDQYGIFFRATPRQADLMIVAGRVAYKMAPRMRLLWEQMAEPRWVIAMGACASTGGPFYDSYSILPGSDQIVPVDIYIPGCPPRPEALIDGIRKLQEMIRSGRREVITI